MCLCYFAWSRWGWGVGVGACVCVWFSVGCHNSHMKCVQQAESGGRKMSVQSWLLGPFVLANTSMLNFGWILDIVFTLVTPKHTRHTQLCTGHCIYTCCSQRQMCVMLSFVLEWGWMRLTVCCTLQAFSSVIWMYGRQGALFEWLWCPVFHWSLVVVQVTDVEAAMHTQAKPSQTRTWPHSEHRFPAPSSKLCQNWLHHWRGTLYFQAACLPMLSVPYKSCGY